MIYRKLKDFIEKDGISTASIFGTLNSRDCIFCYRKNGVLNSYQCNGFYDGKYDFLLEYYVKGITPIYTTECDKITPSIKITPLLKITLAEKLE